MKRYLLAASIFLVSIAASCPAFADDKVRLESGALVFHDTFDRDEDGNLAKAIGKGRTNPRLDTLLN